MMAAVEDRNMK